MTDQLSTAIKVESPSHPEAHRFEGDTLFFLANANPASQKLDRYEGYVWAWRPGWKRPHPITSDRGVTCRGTDRAAVALCVDGVTDQPLAFDLRAGLLEDRDDSLLPVIERIAPLRDGQLAWSGAFAGGGELLLYSSWRDGDDAEVLRAVPLARADRPGAADLVRDGRLWTLSPDRRTVFFLRGGARPGGIGDLWAADLPGGGSAQLISAGVRSFEPLAGTSVAFVTDMVELEGRLHLLPDWHHPTTRAGLVENAHAWYPVDGGRYLYILQVDDQGERGMMADAAHGSVCNLVGSEGVTVYAPSFLPQLGLLWWNEHDRDTDEVQTTYVARPDCQAARAIGKGVELLQADAGQGAVFAVDDGTGSYSFRLSYAPALEGGGLSAARPFLEHVATGNIGPVGPLPDAVIAGTRDGAPMGRGLFIFGPFRGDH
jgi:hypothetical protein